MLNRNHKITVVMPAYNAAKTLGETYKKIPLGLVQDIILVDDASQDQTSELSRDLGIITLQNPQNRGYGGNQKTCYKTALERQADIVIMLHPDGQYDPAFISRIIQPILQNEADIAQHAFGLGLDVAGHQLSGGGVERDLSGTEKEVADADGVVVGANGWRGLSGFDDSFGQHKSQYDVTPLPVGVKEPRQAGAHV